MSTWIIFGTEADSLRRNKMAVMDGHTIDNVKSYLRDCHVCYKGAYLSFDAVEIRDDGIIAPMEKVITTTVDDVTKRFIETYEGKLTSLGTIDTGMELGTDKSIVIEAPKPVDPKTPKDPKLPAANGNTANLRVMKSSAIEQENFTESQTFLSRIHKKNLAIFGSAATILTTFYTIIFFTASWATAMPWVCLISLLMAWAIVWKTSIRPIG